MEERGRLIEFPESERSECPMCGGHNVRTTIETERFTYSDGPEAVELTAQVPVRTCNDCQFRFTDEGAEDVRHEAVCRHLGVLPPKEIIAIRKSYGMSRAVFARVTGIGEASLARWENGLLIQGSAYDRFLFLLTFPENLERLKSRKDGERLSWQHDSSSQNPGQGRRGAGLHTLQVTERETAAADAFILRPTGT